MASHDSYVSGDLVIQSPEAEQLKNDGVIAALQDMFPDIAKQKDLLAALLQDRAVALFAKPPASTFSTATRMWARLKSALMLAAVLATLPASLFLVAVSIAADWARLIMRGEGEKITHRLRVAVAREAWTGVRGTAIVSGAKSTKGLHVCRHLHRAGWRVVLVDIHKNWAAGARWSGCVAAFRTYPVPNKDPIGYLKAIQQIAEEERARLFVPVSIAQFSVYEALAAQRLAKTGDCSVCTLDAAAVALLNDKIKFTHFCERIGVAVPKCFAITSRRELLDLNSRPEVFGRKRFLLKSIHYAATHRADLFTLPCRFKALWEYVEGLEISPTKPWMLQQLLTGTEYSSYTLAHQGKILAHSDNEACLSCLDYAHVGSTQIWQWTRDFCERTKATGQLCFDFMKSGEDGQLYAFECNPRASTILLNFYNHPAFARALYDGKALPEAGTPPLKPLDSAKPVIWIWNEVGELLFWRLPAAARSLSPAAAWRAIREKATILWRSVDAVLDPADPLPFLGLHYVQVPALLLRNIRVGNPWIKVDLCTGKLVEMGGD